MRGVKLLFLVNFAPVTYFIINLKSIAMKKKVLLILLGLFVAVCSWAVVDGYCSRCEGRGTLSEYCAYCKGYGEKYCTTCGGTAQRNCGVCNGSGQLKCNYCRGRGLVKNDTEYCPKCEGYGVVYCSNCKGHGAVECPASDCHDGIVQCRQCNSTGIHKWRCPQCNGTGRSRR